MRSALLCVFFALIVHKESSLAADEDFRPTPIPLNEWNSGAREGNEDARSIGAGKGDADTLQVIATDAPPAVAAVPPHYWEDALKHSVYLTLVRDKIDQLIAKGSVISPDGKPDRQTPQEVDDHDLWEKIKSAPFDRLRTEEPAVLGDITIMSKGRLLEEKNGLRFTEDEMSKEKCKEKCTEDVKAYWSVKRVRQRDAETAPGKYHYELTFSVSSQTPMKQKKPYENPVRTFTVREGTPVEKPQYRIREPVHSHRPQRAIWFHKNILATSPRQRQKHEEGLDRLFTSWFSSEEEQPPKRFKQVSYVPHMYPQYSKLGQAGAPADQHLQKQQVPYPYKPQPQTLYKQPRPPLGPPPVSHPYISHQYVDFGATRNQNQFTPPQTEYKYLPSNVVKTTKTTVLPTPPISYAPLNITMEVTYSNVTEATTRDPEIITAFTMHSKPKPVPTKVSYFPEHVRPPVFNAPPGVFVTMDKKPFKPMPPLKYTHSLKPNKNRPVDFRPSPQVLDVPFSEPDPSEPFRPITIGYAGANTTDSSAHSTVTVSADAVKLKPTRKSKPPKKHDKTNQHRFTTTTPDIITVHNEVLEEMHWANILGAFAKTSPMDAFKLNFSEFTTPLPSTTVSLTTTVQSTPSTAKADRIAITTSKPKRTRPPPKFEKPIKAKKHKRVTSTTTTSTTTRTEKPHHRRPSLDLTPQASSAATKSGWQPQNQTENETLPTTPMTGNVTNITEASTLEPSATTAKFAVTTYRSGTTTRPKTTISEALSSTTETPSTIANSHPKNNRFRQSTVMLKGTSINHDKWSSPYLNDKNKTTLERIKHTSTFGKYPRRKGSNFQGYGSTTKGVDEDRNTQYHIDHAYSKLNVISLSSTTETSTEAISSTTPKPTQATYVETPGPIDEDDVEESNGTDDLEDSDDSEETKAEELNDEQQTKDHEEFIFDTSSADSLQGTKPGEKPNEVEEDVVITTEQTVVNSEHSGAKNKTKCKKKKNQSTSNNETLKSSETENEISVAPLESTTEKLSPVDFFDQIFGLSVDQNETDRSHTESKYVDNDEDLEEFLASINKKKDTNETHENEYEEDDKEENENSPFNNEEENRFARHADSYDEYEDRPFSLLELMAME